MKYGAAVVLGALGMFVSGYILGYSTAVPDAMRAANLNDNGDFIDETMSFEVSGSMPVAGAGAADTEMPAISEKELEEMRLQEIQELKKMIVPLLTDDEIKKFRKDTSKPAPSETAPVEETPPADSPATAP